MKRRLAPETIKKARAAFDKWNGTLPTGAEKLSRGELRALEAAGYVGHAQMKLPSGSIVNVWTWKRKK